MYNVEPIYGDITSIQTEAIVNSAHTSLLKGSGLCGAIHNAAGKELEEECISKYGRCDVGQAVITSAYNLPCKYVIHTVGPRMIDITLNKHTREEKDEQLYNCYKNSLLLADKHRIKTIAFPSISTGIHGFPIEDASNIALVAIRDFNSNETSLIKVYIICINKNEFSIYKNKLI